jgi:hypothetical protein
VSNALDGLNQLMQRSVRFGNMKFTSNLDKGSLRRMGKRSGMKRE